MSSNISSCFHLHYPEIKLEKQEFIAELTQLVGHIDQGKALEHTLDGRLITVDTPATVWLEEIALKTIHDKPKSVTLHVLKDLSIVRLKMKELGLIESHASQLQKLKTLCAKIIFGEDAPDTPSLTQASLLLAVNNVACGSLGFWNLLESHIAEELTLDLFRLSETGNDRGVTGIWEAIYDAATDDKGKAQLWHSIQRDFGSELTLKDFCTGPQIGRSRGRTGLWWIACAAAFGKPESWQWIQERFGEELTLHDFRTGPKTGCEEGKTGLWWILYAAAHETPEMWQWIQERFGEELTLHDFRTGPKAGVSEGETGLWWIACAAAFGKPESWQWIQERFGEELTIDDLRTGPKAGVSEGKTGLWWILSAAEGEPEIWQWILERFGEELTIDDLRTGPKTGCDEGKTGLWWILYAAAKGKPEMWQWIQERFNKELTIDDLRTGPKTGNDVGQTGLLMALLPCAKGKITWQSIEGRFAKYLTLDDLRSGPMGGSIGLLFSLCGVGEGYPEMWKWIEKRFGNELTIDDFRIDSKTKAGAAVGPTPLWVALKAACKGKAVAWRYIESKFIDTIVAADVLEGPVDESSPLELICEFAEKSYDTWGLLCKILARCPKEKLPSQKILANDSTPKYITSILQLHNDILDLAVQVSQNKLTHEELEVKIDELLKIVAQSNRTEGFYLIGKLFFENFEMISESFECYKQVKVGSVLYHEALFEIMSILSRGDYDNHGKLCNTLGAREAALHEALSLAFTLGELAQFADCMKIRKRNLVAMLLGINSVGENPVLLWVDQETNYFILAQKIASYRDNSRALHKICCKQLPQVALTKMLCTYMAKVILRFPGTQPEDLLATLSDVKAVHLPKSEDILAETEYLRHEECIAAFRDLLSPTSNAYSSHESLNAAIGKLVSMLKQTKLTKDELAEFARAIPPALSKGRPEMMLTNDTAFRLDKEFKTICQELWNHLDLGKLILAFNLEK